MKTEHDIAVENGEILINVETHSTDMLIAIFADIADELDRRCQRMSKSEREAYLNSIENIAFCE